MKALPVDRQNLPSLRQKFCPSPVRLYRFPPVSQQPLLLQLVTMAGARAAAARAASARAARSSARARPASISAIRRCMLRLSWERILSFGSASMIPASPAPLITSLVGSRMMRVAFSMLRRLRSAAVASSSGRRSVALGSRMRAALLAFDGHGVSLNAVFPTASMHL